jgi:hypothetical protein
MTVLDIHFEISTAAEKASENQSGLFLIASYGINISEIGPYDRIPSDFLHRYRHVSGVEKYETRSPI